MADSYDRTNFTTETLEIVERNGLLRQVDGLTIFATVFLEASALSQIDHAVTSGSTFPSLFSFCSIP